MRAGVADPAKQPITRRLVRRKHFLEQLALRQVRIRNDGRNPRLIRVAGAARARDRCDPLGLADDAQVLGPFGSVECSDTR